MKAKHPIYHLHWLTKQNTDETISTTSDIQHIAFPISPEIGKGSLEMLQLGFGMVMFRGVCHFEKSATGQLIPLLEFETDYPERSFCVQTQLSGRCCHQEFYPECNVIWEPGLNLFRHAELAKAKVFLDGSMTNDMISMQIACSVLSELLGESYAQELMHKLDIDKSPALTVKPIPKYITSILQSAMTQPLEGAARKFFAQAKLLEYLGALLTYLSVNVSALAPQHKRERIYDLHAYLIGLEGKLPTMNNLAKNFGMSTKLLNEEFTKEFGQSIYSFVQDFRLQQAHVVILNSNTPMKILAANLGYSHVNHFITAFKNKFGYPPGSLRKNH